ncbi:uncharacterized protein raver2 [Garra rufa]|uniref:uncharacterized protein raver2 n=1 Tax=Garra rufa TaxID=137080 RepID=UPI003CCE7F8B
MAAASSIQPPSVHGIKRENSPHPESDSPASRQDEDAASEGITILRDLPELDPEEIEKRLEKTRRELSNRRKILIKNLPQDTTNQEVHEILREYELKYCFVDRNKGTAFVTLLNGDQAQDAIRTLHQTSVRGRDITVQLQPTDSLLCVTNLPYTVTASQFQELVRSYGNIERCFLVYSDLTGHSKGYGFVEYMKKDSASRARSELLGKPLGDRALMVQWADVNQLTSADHLHSKCLCVDRLPLDFEDSEELAHIFSESYKPVFCQLAQDEGSPVRGFAVVEYETAEQAEAMLLEMDRQLIQGQEIRLSLCPPGTSGRSTLAALIAAQGVSQSSCQTSLLGDPPKEVKLPSNPYLNLASVLPGVVLQAPCNSKPQTVQAHTGTYSAVLPPATHPPSQYSAETTSADYTHQYSQQYSQEAMQQWYQHYQAQTYGNTSQDTAAVTECTKEQPQVVVTSSYGDYSSYMHAVSQYYSQTQMSQTAAQVYQHRDVSKEVEVVKTPLSGPLHTSLNGTAQTLLPTYSALPIMPGFITPTHTQTHAPSPAVHTPATPTATDWNNYYYSQARGQKREYPTLPTQEVTSEGPYVGQHSQGLGGQYADYFKKKRI